MSYHYYKYDIPEGLKLEGDIAIDTEAMGLNVGRDRLCVVQLSCGDGEAHIVHFPSPGYEAPNLRALLGDGSRQKIFHFGRFDIAIIEHYLGLEIANVFCTKLASRLCRTFTESHGLKELCSELLDVKLNKQQRSSDWGAESLTQEQIAYAGSDVLYLHALRGKLVEMLHREGRFEVALRCFEFLPIRARLDLMGWPDVDLFAHG